MAVDAFAPQLAFFFNAHSDLIEEVAKFRAARRLWARIMGDRFGAKDPRSLLLRFHTQTAGATLTAQQPENNLVRVAVQALAAVLGGTQSLHTNAYDEALSLPTEKAALLALRTQQILAHESGVANTVDPTAGAFAIESMTSTIEAQAEALIDRIDDMGGMVRAIEQGFPQREIHESAWRLQKAIESGEERIVGVNLYKEDERGPAPRIHRIRPDAEAEQAGRVREFRRIRDATKASQAMRGLERAVDGDENLMPAILKAVTAKVTLGEVCQVLRDHWGEHADSPVV
jgi:methylmalonyl-CoA mutase N-terminal domain/subunit